MSANASSDPQKAPPLRILQCLRAPVGGLFRHVCDLAKAQAERGHFVGIVCDSSTGGAAADAALAALEDRCALGITRLPIGRLPGLSDVAAVRAVARLARKLDVDILHGHGAKGGAYARLASVPRPGKAPVRRFYTPHGGSLHYSRSTPGGFVFLTLEQVMMARTDGLIFVSEYAQRTYAKKVARPTCAQRVIHNGLRADEFEPVAPQKDAADLLFIGELRDAKGVTVLLDALRRLAGLGERPRTLIVGSGDQRDSYVAKAAEYGLGGQVAFHEAMPARDAFPQGRILVVPSLAESLPYIVLEAAAAQIPLLVTRVGGIPEIFGPDTDSLIPPGDATALAAAIDAALKDPKVVAARTKRIGDRVREHFTLDVMCEAVLDFYRQ